MSRRYQTVLTSIFDDTKIRALSHDDRWLFVYLLICKHTNLPGLFLLPINYVVRDTQYPLQRVQEGFRNLSERGFIAYDKASETILVRRWLRHKPLDNPNKVKGAITALEEIPDSPLFAMLLEILDKEKVKGLESLTEALRNRLATLSQPVSVSVAVSVPVIVSESVPVPQAEKTPEEEVGEPEIIKSDPLELFNEFWSQYPRKDKKIDALKNWKKIKNLDDEFSNIISGLSKVKMTDQWNKNGGQYIPLPSTWLNNRQWEDQGIQSDFANTPDTNKSRHDENMDVAKRLLAKVESGEVSVDPKGSDRIPGRDVHSLTGQENQ